MQLQIEKETLVKALGRLQGVVERRNTLPILSNTLLTAENNRLSLHATDLEIGIQGVFPAEVEKAGKVTLPARSFYDIIREMPDGKVNLKLSDKNRMEISSGKILFKLVGLPAEEFPAAPEFGSGEVFSIPADLLKEMFEKSAYAVSNDESRPNINGIYVQNIAREASHWLRLVATDGHRLALVDRQLKPETAIKLDKGVIIPRKGVVELKKLCEENESESISMRFTQSHCVVESKLYRVFIRMIQGDFPNYDQVIPKQTNIKATLNRENFMSTLRRISLLSNEKYRGVLFSFSPSGQLKLSISNPDLGEANEEVSIAYDGDKEQELRFNPRYILDILQVMNGDDVEIHMTDQLGPGVFRDSGDPDATNIVMPMRV